MELPFVTTPMLEEYFMLQRDSQYKYGDKTVVCMQVGAFYEMYEIDNQLGKAKELANILNIQITKKNKSKEHSPKNPFLIGIPIYSVDKFINKMIQHKYTVIKVDQHDIEGKEEKLRKIDKIYSPSTYIESDLPGTNYLVGIIIETCKDLKYAHLSAVDLTTGNSQVYDAFDTINDRNRAENEIFRFLHSLNPSEILFNGEKNEELINTYQLNDKIVHFREILPDYNKPAYQNYFLQKIFKKKSLLSPIEYIGLNMHPDLVTSFVATLQFAYEHDHSIIKKIQPPELISDDKILILNNDSIYQLNLVSSDNSTKFSSLLKVIDKTVTNMGKRLLRERLLRPITSIEILNKRYDMIEKMIPIQSKFEKILGEISDLEKKHRKIYLEKLTPMEFYMLTFSYKSVLSILKIANNIMDNKNLKKIRVRFTKFYEEYNEVFNIDKLSDVTNLNNIQCSLFKEGIYKDIDDIQYQIATVKKYFDELAIEYGSVADSKNKLTAVRLGFNDKEGYHFTTTMLRATKLKKEYPNLTINHFKNIAKIFSEDIMDTSRKLRVLESKIGELVREKYLLALKRLFSSYHETLRRVIKIIAELDVVSSSAKVSKEYVYSRPIIKEKNKSYMNVKDLRHPIIEKIINYKYVGNDIILGEKDYGMLLYGTNASGKSTTIRAIGVCIVMAQSGMFVPCDQLIYSPFSNIVSKISRNDNLFKGESTFLTEMYELRNMLKRASPTSLILADELCSGSESLSATSLVASTITTLIKEKSTFMFSTHLHSLMEITEIRELEKLSIEHFSVNIDGKKISYDRKLKDGHGETLYGLEIANALDLGSDFMMKAFEIRSILEKKENVILSTKKSRYNSSIYVHECLNCKKQERAVGPLHTHHLNQQKDAGACGIIKDKTFHKNVDHNLVVLCRICHENVHKGTLAICRM